MAVLLAAGCRARLADQPVQVSAGDARALLGGWRGQSDVLGMSLDLVVRFEEKDGRLEESIHIPGQGVAGNPVILISGSGLQDRNNGHPSLAGYEPFLWLAGHLTRQGIAVMRYDDRGMNESVGGELGTDTTFDYSTDTEAVFDFLLEHPQINPAQVGVLGHSEGGYIAALVAARRPEVAFAISLAGTAVNGADLLMLQTELVARAEGLDEAEIARRMESNRTEVDLILAQDWDDLEVFLIGAVRQYYLDLPAEQRVSGDELEGAIRDTVAHSMKNNRGWVHYFFSHDPAQDWARVQAPVLAMFGGLDKQLDPEQNAGQLEEVLENNPDATVLVVPNANHLFQEAATGGADEYARLPHEFVDGLLETITDWLLERLDVQ